MLFIMNPLHSKSTRNLMISSSLPSALNALKLKSTMLSSCQNDQIVKFRLFSFYYSQITLVTRVEARSRVTSERVFDLMPNLITLRIELRIISKGSHSCMKSCHRSQPTLLFDDCKASKVALR